eukprot:COSAG05_NODE_205_length_14184_cov_81.700887_10_plen_88_part_00
MTAETLAPRSQIRRDTPVYPQEVPGDTWQAEAMKIGCQDFVAPYFCRHHLHSNHHANLNTACDLWHVSAFPSLTLHTYLVSFTRTAS